MSKSTIRKSIICLKLLYLAGPEFDQFEHPLLLEDSTPKRRPTNTKEFEWHFMAFYDECHMT